jgi:hypothetical protein
VARTGIEHRRTDKELPAKRTPSLRSGTIVNASTIPIDANTRPTFLNIFSGGHGKKQKIPRLSSSFDSLQINSLQNHTRSVKQEGQQLRANRIYLRCCAERHRQRVVVAWVGRGLSYPTRDPGMGQLRRCVSAYRFKLRGGDDKPRFPLGKKERVLIMVVRLFILVRIRKRTIQVRMAINY